MNWLFGKRLTLWDVFCISIITHYSSTNVLSTFEAVMYYVIAIVIGIFIENHVPENKIAENAIRRFRWFKKRK